MKKIIHIDMDAFFASIEQRDNPQLRGFPVVVGGDPDSRGVVSTCSYEARKFGIHSAMPAAKARNRCPQAIFVRPRMAVYKMVSAQIRTVFSLYTDLVEPLSLDEAYLDVTVNRQDEISATRLAKQILAAVKKETGLTASAGVSYNKFLAKVASDLNKPAGITVITPEQAIDFIAELPIEKFYGIGKVTARKMRAMGINTGADLRQLDLGEMSLKFGKSGVYFYNVVRGIDKRAVQPHRKAKSIGREITLPQDIENLAEISGVIAELSKRVEDLLERARLLGYTVTLKIKYDDFTIVTRSRSLPVPVFKAIDLREVCRELLTKTEAGKRKVRLIGVIVSNFAGIDFNQAQMYQPELPLKFKLKHCCSSIS